MNKKKQNHVILIQKFNKNLQFNTWSLNAIFKKQMDPNQTYV